MSHPRHQLDPLIHLPVRFSLMASLAAVEETDFRSLRDALEVSDSLLSQHVRVLEDAEYITVRKVFVGKRARTWVALTPIGRRAFHDHYSILRFIASDIAVLSQGTDPTP